MDHLRALLFAYVASLAAFLALDALWLGSMYERLYKPSIGALLRDTPAMAPAALFYLLYALGLTVLVIATAPAGSSIFRAMGLGAVLGLVAYGTYDLSNYATLRGWPLLLTIADMAWGTFATALAAGAGFWAARTFG